MSVPHAHTSAHRTCDGDGFSTLGIFAQKAAVKQAKVTRSVKAVEKTIKETKDDLIVEELKALVGEASL